MAENMPVDPDTVAEVAPGQGEEPGSVYYGGSEIHQDGAGEGAAAGAGSDASSESATTEAGTFEELPLDTDDKGATGD